MKNTGKDLKEKAADTLYFCFLSTDLMSCLSILSNFPSVALRPFVPTEDADCEFGGKKFLVIDLM